MRWREFQPGTTRPAYSASWNKPAWRQEYLKQVYTAYRLDGFAILSEAKIMKMPVSVEVFSWATFLNPPPLIKKQYQDWIQICLTLSLLDRHVIHQFLTSEIDDLDPSCDYLACFVSQ